MKHVVFRHRLFLLLIVSVALPSNVLAHTEAQTDPPCDGWTLHTRTLSTICPEVILDGLTGQGIAAIGSIAFDAIGNLYVSRPATGQVLRLTARDGNFDAPQVIASGLDFPGGLACSEATCFSATDTTITRLTDGKAIVTGLPSGDLRPLRIGPDGQLYTTRGEQTISLTIDGTDERPVIETSTLPLDFAWSPDGTLWFSDGNQSVRSMHASVTFALASVPSGIAFYPNTPDLAFPQFAGGLLVVTSGSWNTATIDGYELWIVPFVRSDQPGTPIRLIPADTERSSADAALVALSFFPDHPIAVAVSPEGWIYAATREGRVIRLRPRRN